MATRKLLAKKKPKEAKISGNKYAKEGNQKYVNADMHVDNVKPLKQKVSSDAAPVPVQQQLATEPATKPVLHANALYGLVGKIVMLASKHSDADIAAILITVLLRFAALFAGNYIRYGEIQHHARTFATIVGNSSKSRINVSTKTVDRLFDGYRSSYRYLPVPLSKVEDIIYEVRDATFEPDIFSRKKNKKIKADHGGSSKNLYVLDKNFAFSLSSKTAELNTMSSVLNGLFDDGNAAIQISKDNYMKCTGADVAILANIQRAELDAMRDKLDIPNGFANCFLWMLTDPQGCIPFPEPIPDDKVEYFRNRIAQCVDNANAHSIAVTLTANARKLWDKAYPGLITKYSGFAGSVVDRNEVHALRLALIYALAAGRREIQTKDLKAAIAVVNYSCESALLLFNGAHQDKRKEKLLQALRSAPNQEMSSSEITKTVFGNNISANEKDEILRELETSKLIVVKVVAGKTKGKKTTMVKLAAAEHQQS